MTLDQNKKVLFREKTHSELVPLPRLFLRRNVSG